jgi:ribonuclease HI
MKKKKIREFYTDGACSGNPGKGGFGVVEIIETTILKKEKETDKIIQKVTMPAVNYFYSSQSDLTTNNREELKAIIHVMELAAADPDNEYLVYSDSAYAVNMINDWIWRWAKSDWCNSKHKEVENVDLVQEIYKYLTIEFFNFQIKKCKGHAGIIGNELADALATNDYKKYCKTLIDNEMLIETIAPDMIVPKYNSQTKKLEKSNHYVEII